VPRRADRVGAAAGRQVSDVAVDGGPVEEALAWLAAALRLWKAELLVLVLE